MLLESYYSSPFKFESDDQFLLRISFSFIPRWTLRNILSRDKFQVFQLCSNLINFENIFKILIYILYDLCTIFFFFHIIINSNFHILQIFCSTCAEYRKFLRFFACIFICILLQSSLDCNEMIHLLSLLSLRLFSSSVSLSSVRSLIMVNHYHSASISTISFVCM